MTLILLIQLCWSLSSNEISCCLRKMIRRHWDHDRYDIVSVEKRGITTEKKLNQKTRISLLKRLRKYEWEKKERNERTGKKRRAQWPVWYNHGGEQGSQYIPNTIESNLFEPECFIQSNPQSLRRFSQSSNIDLIDFNCFTHHVSNFLSNFLLLVHSRFTDINLFASHSQWRWLVSPFPTGI